MPENFREHALDHVRRDEAYAIETWEDAKHKATLVLYAIPGPPNLNRVKSLKRTLRKTQSLIYGMRLRQIERKRKIKKGA